jgi:hypothetical protein
MYHMKNQTIRLSRREFIQKSVFASATTGVAVMFPNFNSHATSIKGKDIKSLLKGYQRSATHFSTFAQATLHESPLLNRIKMAKQRGRSYPMDSLDFIMVDLERPETLTRHADFFTGDLTGRYLDFLATSAHLEPSDHDRMQALFARMLACQAPNGTFGRVPGVYTEPAWMAASKVFIGLLSYY